MKDTLTQQEIDALIADAQKKKHTETPWHKFMGKITCGIAANNNDGIVIRQTSEVNQADLDRIVECVNGCDIIENPSALGELLAAACELEDILSDSAARAQMDSFTVQPLKLALQKLGIKVTF